MSAHPCPRSPLQRGVVVVATAFGLLSLFAGGRVLLGISTPEHVVVGPLLIFNTVMGGVFIAAALLIRTDAFRGRFAAGVIALLELAVWLALIGYALAGGAVATDSIIAMGVRSVVWGTIYLILVRVAPATAVAVRSNDGVLLEELG